MKKLSRLLWLAAPLFLAACQPTPTGAPTAFDPEGHTGRIAQEAVVLNDYMVVAANPYAAEAGADILRQGGHAIDAAVAVQAMLTLVEPQSSGIGGGAFILYWDAKTKQLYTLDARETAPAEADENLFLNTQGQPVRWIDAVVGGRSVGTPGIVKGLEEAHQRFGRLPWAHLFESAIERAEEGFVVSDRLAQLVAMGINPGLAQLEPAKSYFFPNGQPLAAGTLKKNPALAESLRTIANEGADGFYQGPLAEAMVQAVRHSAIAPGRLNIQDLANYHVVWREPVCGAYRELDVCSMGPPSSGGTTIVQMLKLLEGFELGEHVNTEALHYFTQASRLAFADRNTYSADPDFIEVPVQAMLADDYIEMRRSLISERDMGTAQAGDLAGGQWVMAASLEQPNTSHFSIVDQEGNAVSITTTIEMGFGSTVMAGGFLLNNQLTDFSLNPRNAEGLVANRVEPGKRPRSSMSPVIVFDEHGQPLHVLGSPGGPRIINYVAQTILGLVDWNMDMQEAIDMPRMTNMNGSTAVEAELAPLNWVEDLTKRGHTVEVRALNSGLHGITRLPDGRLLGGADPRREGHVAGQ
ncbi:gamma-glutamyltransferase [Aliidiomarina taiwanensis]|uniref:Glutathione hydrolase proenzyme n=1 Tax=Aliidiomarina taiwanensis TaxID=946228 RepID=A0A432X9G4_9GAMM|nr:gamma-glutamyltransferase [Aliidiomarina taiwanensis]RUO44063.1 gamma-glutamyltransferase [Aliidiomarina taiwanensis]